MKKMIACLLAIGIAVLCVGCAAKTDTEAKVLTVAMSPDFSPMEFVDSSKSGQEQYVGYDVMLANYIADEMGLTLEIKPMSFDACQTAVQLGTVDMSISGFSWMAEREENFCLSDYYIAGDNETEQVIITTEKFAGTLNAAEDFADLKVGAQAASLQERLCNEELPESVEVVLFKDINDAVLALQTGKIDAPAVAKGNAEAIMVNNQDVVLSGFSFDVDPKYENNVILMNKEDTELLATVNTILAKAKAAGLYETWYADAQSLAGIETAVQISYDDDGNVITDG